MPADQMATRHVPAPAEEDESAVLFKRALELQREGRLEQAAEGYQRVIALGPEAGAAYCNLGHLLLCLHRRQASLAVCERAVALLPKSPEAWANFGNVLLEMGKVERAATAYEAALRFRPDWAPAINNLGTAMLEQGRLIEAAAAYERALAIEPKFADARLNRGILHLLQGEYARGWVDYEARLNAQRTMTPRFAGAARRWRGEPLDGAKILLYAEQGLGDTIQFLRYVPLVRAAGGEVILQVPPRLKRLTENMSDQVQVIGAGEVMPELAWQCPLMSLPLVFRTRVETVPARVPYLMLPAEERLWTQKLALPQEDWRVGLVWAGTPDHPRDWARSITLDELQPLLRVEGVQFFSLQIGDTEQPQGRNFPVTDLDLDGRDMADTATKILELDLVIAVDTAVAHLAGALGKLVWLLLPTIPDWRWLLEREDSPWYPTMRLFRQEKYGGWKPVIEKVWKELTELARKAPHRASCVAASWERTAANPPGQGSEDPMEAVDILHAAISPAPKECKICKAPSTLFGVVDFHKSCIEAQGKRLNLSGIPIYYRRCERCKFLFTEAYDRWTNSTFAEWIYNTEYALVDPDYVKTRPRITRA